METRLQFRIPLLSFEWNYVVIAPDLRSKEIVWNAFIDQGLIASELCWNMDGFLILLSTTEQKISQLSRRILDSDINIGLVSSLETLSINDETKTDLISAFLSKSITRMLIKQSWIPLIAGAERYFFYPDDMYSQIEKGEIVSCEVCIDISRCLDIWKGHIVLRQCQVFRFSKYATQNLQVGIQVLPHFHQTLDVHTATKVLPQALSFGATKTDRICLERFGYDPLQNVTHPRDLSELQWLWRSEYGFHVGSETPMWKLEINDGSNTMVPCPYVMNHFAPNGKPALKVDECIREVLSLAVMEAVAFLSRQVVLKQTIQYRYDTSSALVSHKHDIFTKLVVSNDLMNSCSAEYVLLPTSNNPHDILMQTWGRLQQCRLYQVRSNKCLMKNQKRPNEANNKAAVSRVPTVHAVPFPSAEPATKENEIPTLKEIQKYSINQLKAFLSDNGVTLPSRPTKKAMMERAQSIITDKLLKIK